MSHKTLDEIRVNRELIAEADVRVLAGPGGDA